ncbi:MAG: hypothetical protein ABR921_04205 [Candidatus Sulfotelmatobacter sp.]
MKVHLIALLIVVALTGSMAAAAHAYGWHSTPGIRLMLANIPGIAVGLWVGMWMRENEYVFYVLSAATNWVFYFYLIKGALLLKRKLSN